VSTEKTKQCRPAPIRLRDHIETFKGDSGSLTGMTKGKGLALVSFPA